MTFTARERSHDSDTKGALRELVWANAEHSLKSIRAEKVGKAVCVTGRCRQSNEGKLDKSGWCGVSCLF